jgi:lysozyme
MNIQSVSQEGIDLIKRFEGYSGKPYLCPAGKLTIGYGHVIRDDEEYLQLGIDPKTAENILKQDVNCVERKINHLVSYPLVQPQYDALVSLVYNIGVYAFEKSTLLRVLNGGNVEKTALEFRRWVYAGGKKLDGLIKRRSAEEALFIRKTGFFTQL